MESQLTDLPDALLPKVASYLPRTSCVSFAMAMTDSPNISHQQPSAISIAIATSSKQGWEDYIDFKDIQDICGRSLTDNDIRWVLLAIDGESNKIKSLKLTHCVGITGAGLEPLRGSIVLERIDLSLVGDHENPNINPEPPISASITVPILNSIIEREDNSLVHIQLPKKWRIERSDVLTQFLQRFDRVLTERRYPCTRPAGIGNPACEEICEPVDNFPDGPAPYTLVCWQEHEFYQYERYGMVAMSCYQCKKNICGACEWNAGGINFCLCCEKFYCQECNDVEHCQGAPNCPRNHQATSCKVCNVFKVCNGQCGCAYCPDCEPTWITCQFCAEFYCQDCSIECMNICEGCERANCDGRWIRNCPTAENEEKLECVIDDEQSHTFCLDCRVEWGGLKKKRKKGNAL